LKNENKNKKPFHPLKESEKGDEKDFEIVSSLTGNKK
jgi:hypothetical protein